MEDEGQASNTDASGSFCFMGVEGDKSHESASCGSRVKSNVVMPRSRSPNVIIKILVNAASLS